MSRLTAGLVCAPALTLAMGAAASAQQRCPPVEGRSTEVLVCRGALSMGGHRTPLTADADLPLRFRASPVPAGDDGAGLPPGACWWAGGRAGSGESRVVVVPLNGPLAGQTHPIGTQARACAADLTCVMRLCASDVGGELLAVDGLIRLSFGDSAHRRVDGRAAARLTPGAKRAAAHVKP